MARRSRLDEVAIPAHPYRDTALVYGVLSVLLVGIAWLTGSNLVRAILVAVSFFVIATAWSWWKFQGRIKRRDAAAAPVAPAKRDGPDAGDNGEGGARRDA